MSGVEVGGSDALPASTSRPQAPVHAPDVDVAILGGGLSGLTLALHLRRADPTLSVRIIERHVHPVGEAAFKIGESTVEIGARYFAETLGLADHLRAHHVRKFGFRFFFGEGHDRIDTCREMGPADYLAMPTWQIDRGRFETHLTDVVRTAGVEVIEGARVAGVDLAAPPGADAWHRVRWTKAGALHEGRARWVVDAMGRASLLKRQLKLARPSVHDAHAAWFRLDATLDVDAWGRSPEWRNRVARPDRWKSTNHFVGRGYWVWTIPLAGGAAGRHSVGIVAHPSMHPPAQFATFESTMQWLARHQPSLHAAIEPLRGRLMDFAGLRRFAHDCARVVSAERWALAGEAGRFLDPFYSPGSDFIAIGNTLIADLVLADRRGEPLAQRAAVAESLLRSYYENTLTLYVGQYGIFGDRTVLPCKVLWDYTIYWSLMGMLFFRGAIGDAALLARHAGAMQHSQRLNKAMQRLLAQWADRRAASGAAAQVDPADLLDQCTLPWFVALNRDLVAPPEGFDVGEALEAAADRLTRLAAELAPLAEADGADATALRQRIAERPLAPAPPMLTGAWCTPHAPAAPHAPDCGGAPAAMA